MKVNLYNRKISVKTENSSFFNCCSLTRSQVYNDKKSMKILKG